MPYLSSAIKLDGPPVAANQQDRRVLVQGTRILVNTDDGSLFAHDVTGNTIGVPFQLSGPKVAANPQDRRVFILGSRIVVTTDAGAVFAHDLSGDTIGVPFRLSGPPVASNPQDRHVLTVGSRILVVTADGSVFAHDVSGDVVGIPFQLSGPKVAANPQDRWVVLAGTRIVVITTDGSVFAHDLSGNSIGVPFALPGARVAANPQDRDVLPMLDRLLVRTADGGVFAHRIIEGAEVVNGGPGVTSATSQNSPALVLAQVRINAPPLIDMAWRDLDGNINVMVDLLHAPTVSNLQISCLDRPALAVDGSTGTLFLAWTGPDQSLNVMSSPDGLAFGNRVTLPGRSVFGPAVTFYQGRLVVAWIDAAGGALTMLNGIGGQVVATPETGAAAPALTAAIQDDGAEALIVAWLGTNADRQLNVMSTYGDLPPTSKVSLPTDGPAAATSDFGPSLAFVPFRLGSVPTLALNMGWTGLPGGPDHDNHLNIIISEATSNFLLFDFRMTVAPVSGAGLAITNVVDRANLQDRNAQIFCAWVDRQSRINTAFYYGLPVIPA